MATQRCNGARMDANHSWNFEGSNPMCSERETLNPNKAIQIKQRVTIAKALENSKMYGTSLESICNTPPLWSFCVPENQQSLASLFACGLIRFPVLLIVLKSSSLRPGTKRAFDPSQPLFAWNSVGSFSAFQQHLTEPPIFALVLCPLRAALSVPSMLIPHIYKCAFNGLCGCCCCCCW